MLSLGKLLVAACLALQACAKTIMIDSGKSGLTFDPNTINAAVGDILEFHFYARNHSVVLGDFNNPCVPATSGGFFSGFIATASGESSTTFSVRINDTNPFPFYCSQNVASHCKSGMVGVVNPSGNNTLANYQNAAKNVATAVSPSSVFGGTIASSNSTTPASTTSSGSPASTSGSATSATARPSTIGGGGGGSGAGTVEASAFGILGAIVVGLLMA